MLATVHAAVPHRTARALSSPAPGAAINGDVPIIGTAVIDPFQKYELHYKQEPSGDDAYIYFAGGTSPVINGQLGRLAGGRAAARHLHAAPARGQGGRQLRRVLHRRT